MKILFEVLLLGCVRVESIADSDIVCGFICGVVAAFMFFLVILRKTIIHHDR